MLIGFKHGGLWQKADQKRLPSSPVNQRDRVNHSLSFSGVVIAAWLRFEQTQCEAAAALMFRSNNLPWFRKSIRVNSATDVSNRINWAKPTTVSKAENFSQIRQN